MQSHKKGIEDLNSTPSVPSVICHVITTLERGGAENQLLVLVKAQIKQGSTVTIVPLKGKPELDSEFREIGAKIYDLRTKSNPIMQIYFLRKALPKSGHILHAHLPQAELISRFARVRTSVFIITRHFGGQFYPGRNKFLSKALSRISSEPAKAVIAISSAVRNQLIANSEIRSTTKIQRIYYGFDCSEFRKSGLRKDLPYGVKNGKTLVLGTIARLSDEKDYPTLFKSFKMYLELDPSAVLRVAGVGPLADNLIELARNLGIDKNITWEGKIADIPNFLNSIDIFILASKFEGFGMVLVEAMCMKKKIIAAGNSAILEVLGEMGAGIFFETSNSSSLLSKIVHANNMTPRDFEGEQNLQLSKFSVKNLIEQTNSLYQKSARECNIIEHREPRL